MVTMNNPLQPPNNMNLPQPVADAPVVGNTTSPVQQIPVSQGLYQQPSAHAPVQAGVPATRRHTTAGAQDRDIIEPEWVHAVERVMRAHIEDPRKLAAEIAALKAQYIHKRYGKDIKGPPGGQP